MRVADEVGLDISRARSSNYDGLIMFSYALIAITLLAVTYAASTSPGTSPGEFISMSAFP